MFHSIADAVNISNANTEETPDSLSAKKKMFKSLGGYFSITDAVKLSAGVNKEIPSAANAQKEFYGSISESLKGRTLDIYIKRFADEENIEKISGNFVRLDEAGKYLIAEISKAKDFIYFARVEDAILAITNGHNELLYANKNVFDYGKFGYEANSEIEHLRLAGKFNPVLFPKIESEPAPNPSQVTLRVA